jgi:hypothetical protein
MTPVGIDFVFWAIIANLQEEKSDSAMQSNWPHSESRLTPSASRHFQRDFPEAITGPGKMPPLLVGRMPLRHLRNLMSAPNDVVPQKVTLTMQPSTLVMQSRAEKSFIQLLTGFTTERTFL